tara:strand:- start:29245 stop:31203 length:1959 start_codon:yes stop_codon:yes gene_type:complete
MNPNKKEPIKTYEIYSVDGDMFTPSAKESEVVTQTIELFRRTKQNRDRAFAYFDGMNLINYIEDSVERFNTNLYLREGMEDWQSGFNDGFTRNKVLSMTGKLAEQVPIASATPRGEEDTLRAQIITDLYHYTEELDDYETFMNMFILELFVKGTAIGYEDIEYKKKYYRDVKGVGDNMTVTEKKTKCTKFYAEIVPLEEYYPANVGIMDAKNQPYSFRRKLMDYADFKDKYGHYAKSKFISPKSSAASANGTIPYYLDFITSDVDEGLVELICYYDSVGDQYVMMANGIWLNPLGTQEEVQPLPWAHKEQPFFSAINEPFGMFFYGKSLPNKLSSMQDVLNVLQNMIVDQSLLSIFSPLITAGFDGFEDDIIRPGRHTSIDTGGLALQSAIMPLQFPTPSGFHQYIMEYTRRIMEESSLDQVSSGQAGQGAERTTAFEIQQAAAGVAATLTMVARYLNSAIKRKAVLRMQNILQFGFQPNATIIPGVLADKDPNKPFATFSFNNTELSEGRRGTRVLELYRTEDAVPPRENVAARSIVSSEEQGRPVEVTAIAPEYIRNIRYDIKLALDRRKEHSTLADQALLLQQIQVLTQIGGDRVNIDEPLTMLATSMGLDPTKIIREDQPQPSPEGQTGQEGVGGQLQGAANRALAQA